MRKIARDIAEGMGAGLGPVAVPKWLHHCVWAMIWTLWIAGAVGFVYERLA